MKRRIIIFTVLLAGFCNALNAQVNNARLSVYVFLSPECPLSQNYTRTLNILDKEYRDRVHFIGVIPGRTYSSSEIKQYLSDYKVSFEIVKDTALAIVTKMNATVTPEAILIDNAQHILYRGAIDDWAVSLGKKKLSPTISYLKNAIEQVLNGNEVIVQSTKPVGCLINDY